jgi:AraC family transcriptional regulator, activator of mtrCDE
MDTLSEILRTLKLSGSLYFRTELSAPWGLEVPVDSQAVRFHVVVQGTCWLRLVGVPKAIPLTTGDLALVPYGKAHQLSDDHSTPCRPLFDVLEEQQFAGHGTLRYGGGGGLTQLVCGYLGFVPEASHPLLESLPEPLILPGEQTQQQHGLSTVIELITSKKRAPITWAPLPSSTVFQKCCSSRCCVSMSPGLLTEPAALPP